MTSFPSSFGKIFFVTGAVSAAIGVAAGAFGAHGLKSMLPPDMLAVYETAVRYHMYHAFGLIAAGWAAHDTQNSKASVAGWCFVTGTLLFSGSLYILTLTGLRWLGAITPFGGVLFIAGWILLALSFPRNVPSRRGKDV
ncbi:MAG: DUF423 domain-containing protein [Bacteroidetes bacterium]|nr:DUF423 domain-containing protein [Bacteroidota bacterium]MCW5897143.1 DUF423 domain-containing protein [Bacteroidota bacterium]